MAGESDRPQLTLLTFAPMVDSEFSRLLLAHYGPAYRERDHLLAKASVLTLLHGGFGRIPLLYGPGVRVTGPRHIVKHFEPLAPEERRLVPTTGEAADQVGADWITYNDGLALDTARFAYHHLLPLRELMTPLFAAPVPSHEGASLRSTYPGLASLLRLLLRLGPEQAERSRENIRTFFAKTDARIADGRPYLCGDRLTLGDLALASAAAPLLQPKGYGAKMPDVALLPCPLRKTVRELRATPTAAFVQRLYVEGLAAGRANA